MCYAQALAGCFFTFQKHAGVVKSLALSPDGSKVVVADSKLKLTEIETGITIRTFSGHTDWFDSLVYAPGAQDKPVKMWNVMTGSNIATLRGNNYWVRDLAFSPDGTKLASASLEGTILLWNLEAVE